MCKGDLFVFMVVCIFTWKSVNSFMLHKDWTSVQLFIYTFKMCIWVNINSSNRMVMIMWFLSSYLNFWHLITAVRQHWLHLSSKHYWCKHRRVPLLSSFTLLVCLLSAAARSGMLWWRHEGSAVWLIDFAVVWPAWVPFFPFGIPATGH